MQVRIYNAERLVLEHVCPKLRSAQQYGRKSTRQILSSAACGLIKEDFEKNFTRELSKGFYRALPLLQTVGGEGWVICRSLSNNIFSTSLP